ncbi:MAG: hypothetical protein ABSH09_08615 [Bryobacteraceae bacterium]
MSAGCHGLPTVSRRWRERTGWLFPAAILAALPKCPACLAAYFVLATGCGISVTAAARLRMLLITSCVACIVYLAVKLVRGYSITRSRPAASTNAVG